MKKKKNLSDFGTSSLPKLRGMRFGIVVSEWNSEITQALYSGAIKTLTKNGIDKKDIVTSYVPGSFELTLGAQMLAEHADVDAVICLGCVIQGETPHFNFICQGVSYGITELNIMYQIPFIFGVLTTNTYKQAAERAGGKHGNKGDEAAVTAIKMLAMQQEVLKKARKK